MFSEIKYGAVVCVLNVASRSKRTVSVRLLLEATRFPPRPIPFIVSPRRPAPRYGIIRGMSVALTDSVRVTGLPSSDEWRLVVHPTKEGGYWGEVPALRG